MLKRISDTVQTFNFIHTFQLHFYSLVLNVSLGSPSPWVFLSPGLSQRTVLPAGKPGSVFFQKDLLSSFPPLFSPFLSVALPWDAWPWEQHLLQLPFIVHPVSEPSPPPACKLLGSRALRSPSPAPA